MWDVFKTPFGGFAAADFDAYTPEKWSSHLHNRARMGVADKLSAIARQVRERLETHGAQFSVEANDARPSVFNGKKVDAQWVFLTRPEADRKQLATLIDKEHSIQENLHEAGHHKRHLMFGVKVHQDGVEVMLGVHRRAWVDVRNGLRKLADGYESDVCAQLLGQLGATAAGQLHLVGPLGVVPVPSLQVQDVVDNLKALDEGQGQWCLWGRNFPVDLELVREEGFAQEIAAIFEALLPLYHFLLWSRQNDHLSLDSALKEKQAEARRGGVTLEPGTSVSVIAGLFSGKTGVVQEIDKKGMVKVSVGRMVIQVKGTALKVLG